MKTPGGSIFLQFEVTAFSLSRLYTHTLSEAPRISLQIAISQLVGESRDDRHRAPPHEMWHLHDRHGPKL